MNDRLKQAWRNAWGKTEQQQWIYGWLGRKNSDGTTTFAVAGRQNYVYVKIRQAGGAQTTAPARNDMRVEWSADLPVKMRLEGTTLVIVDRVAREDLATLPDSGGSVVPSHIHDDRYFTEDEHVNVSAGAADASKPIKLGTTGLLSNTFLDVELSSIAGLTSAADRLPYYTGLGTASLATFTAFARTFLDDADATTVRATLGLVIGTNVQAFDATLLSIALLGTAADRIAYTTGVDTWAETPLTAFGRSLIDDAAAVNARTTLGLVIGTDVQAQDAELAAIAGLTSAADRLPYYTGLGTASLATFTAFARTLIDDADAATARTTLALGTIAVEAETNYLLAAGTRPLTAEWDIGEDMAIRAERIEARDVEGLSVQDDGGNQAFIVQDGGNVLFGKIYTSTVQFATISAGLITVTSNVTVVDTEAAAAADDLDRILGGVEGMILILSSDSSARDVTVKNGVVGTGTINCGADRLLDSNRDVLMLRYSSGPAAWLQCAFNDNG